MHNLAVSLSGRQDGDPDYALAAKWYGEAAAYGLADSQFNLGVLEEHGLGMPKNLALPINGSPLPPGAATRSGETARPDQG